MDFGFFLILLGQPFFKIGSLLVGIRVSIFLAAINIELNLMVGSKNYHRNT